MTWEEVKLATLQKMFAAEGNTIPTDESTQEYIAGMPHVANEALQLLSTAGKFIVKKLEIAHHPVKNLLDYTERNEIHLSEGDPIVFGDETANSYYFEVCGQGKITIVSGEYTITRTFNSLGKYVPFKGNTLETGVKVTFESEYPFSVKNPALYKAKFPTDEDVQTFGEKTRYDLTEMVDDFYQLDTAQIYFEGQEIKYIQTHDYFQEGGKVFTVDRDKPGIYTIYYKAYPNHISSATEDDYELPVDPEVVVLLPLYMASQLYKDDDNGIATAYRNEFEVAFERLNNAPDVPIAEYFVSESGWI